MDQGKFILFSPLLGPETLGKVWWTFTPGTVKKWIIHGLRTTNLGGADKVVPLLLYEPQTAECVIRAEKKPNSTRHGLYGSPSEALTSLLSQDLVEGWMPFFFLGIIRQYWPISTSRRCFKLYGKQQVPPQHFPSLALRACFSISTVLVQESKSCSDGSALSWKQWN